MFDNHTCYLFDMLHINKDVLGYLKAILQDKNVTKVFHDCRQDSAALYYQFGIKIQAVLDTQVCLWPALLKQCTCLISACATPLSGVHCLACNTCGQYQMSSATCVKQLLGPITKTSGFGDMYVSEVCANTFAGPMCYVRSTWRYHCAMQPLGHGSANWEIVCTGFEMKWCKLAQDSLTWRCLIAAARTWLGPDFI